MKFLIYCLRCRRERWASRVEGARPTRHGRPDMRRPLMAFNRCECGELYEALPGGATQRKHQKRLERYGQGRLGGVH